jgi:hypothetical protein
VRKFSQRQIRRDWEIININAGMGVWQDIDRGLETGDPKKEPVHGRV